MLRSKTTGRMQFMLAAAYLLGFLFVIVQAAVAADSSCVTCHLDKEMLKKTVKVEKGKKSAMQSGAG